MTRLPKYCGALFFLAKIYLLTIASVNLPWLLPGGKHTVNILSAVGWNLTEQNSVISVVCGFRELDNECISVCRWEKQKHTEESGRIHTAVHVCQQTCLSSVAFRILSSDRKKKSRHWRWFMVCFSGLVKRWRYQVCWALLGLGSGHVREHVSHLSTATVFFKQFAWGHVRGSH